jgi:radical S-adenosyl methionine domain-containing protein 2
MYCFVKKENCELSFEELKIVVDKIKIYFDKYNIKGRINLAGGEPLLSRNIDRLIDFIYSKDIEVSIITNGYYLDETFINKHKNQIKTIGISVDSLDYDTNIKIGRCFKANVLSKEQLIFICNKVKEAGIKLKINTCLSKLNINEDFNDFINEVKPNRYKVFQMMCDDNDSINKNNIVLEEEIKQFLNKINYDYIYESSEDMKQSYIIVDSEGNISTNNSHISNISIFTYELDEAIKLLNVDYKNYIKRYI